MIGASKQLAFLTFLLTVQTVLGFPVQAATSEPPDDSFDSQVFNTCLWFDYRSEAPPPVQNGRLILSTDAPSVSSSHFLLSQYSITGDFQISIDFELGPEWEDYDGSQSDYNYLALGFWSDGAHQVLGLLAQRSESVNPSFHLNNTDGANQTYTGLRFLEGANSGSMRLTRTGNLFVFEAKTDGDWFEVERTQGFDGPGYVVLQNQSDHTSHSQTVMFDNFKLTYGGHSYHPLYMEKTFVPNGELMLGGVLVDYIAQKYFGPNWKDKNPQQFMKENGMNWVRTTMTNVNSEILSSTPPSQWDDLRWQNEFWSSREWVTQILKDSREQGMRLNVAFFFSDEAAHLSIQNAPNAWAGLLVKETADKLREFTQSSAQHFLDEGLNVEVYELGNEIDEGIMNFLAGDRIPPPQGTWAWTDMEYMRQEVWPIEAQLLQAAAEGIRAVNPQAKIVLHPAGWLFNYSDFKPKAFFKAMIEMGVDFDIAGLSWAYSGEGWPAPDYSTDCFYQRVQETTDAIALLGKKVLISEGNYSHDKPGYGGKPMKDFPFTKEGQAKWARRMLKFISSNPNVIGFHWFYPEWYPGSDIEPETDPSEVSGLFENNQKPLPALLEYQVNLAAPPPTMGMYYDRAHDGHGLDLQRAGEKYFLFFYSYESDPIDETKTVPAWYLTIGDIVEGKFVPNDIGLMRFTYDKLRSPPQTVDPEFEGNIHISFNVSSSEPACSDGADRSSAHSLAIFEWEIDGKTGVWCVEPLIFLNESPSLNPSGSWFAGPTDEGWGFTAYFEGTHFDSGLRYAVFYYYDENGQPRWSLGAAQDAQPMGAFQMNSFEGYLVNQVPEELSAHPVGSIEYQFQNFNQGRLNINISDTEGSTGTWQRQNIEVTPISSPY